MKEKYGKSNKRFCTFNFCTSAIKLCLWCGSLVLELDSIPPAFSALTLPAWQSLRRSPLPKFPTIFAKSLFLCFRVSISASRPSLSLLYFLSLPRSFEYSSAILSAALPCFFTFSFSSSLSFFRLEIDSTSDFFFFSLSLSLSSCLRFW